MHVPAAEQMPFPEHAGEHAVDWISVNDKSLSMGSWVTSGTESQSTTRSDPAVTATQTLEESARELPGRGVDALTSGWEGRAEKAERPE